jgi:hypothetical protein
MGARHPKMPYVPSVRGQRTHWVLQWAEEKMAESTEVRSAVTKVVTVDMMDVGSTFLIENLHIMLRSIEHLFSRVLFFSQDGLLNKHCEFPRHNDRSLHKQNRSVHEWPRRRADPGNQTSLPRTGSCN